MEEKTEQQRRYEEFLTKLEAAKQKGADAELALYAICLEFDQSDVWRMTGLSFARLLQTKGINSSKYANYKAAVTLLGVDAPQAAGMAAISEIMRLFKIKVEGGDLAARTAMSEVYSKTLERLTIFRAEHHTSPSKTHTVTLVQEEAERLGVKIKTDTGKQSAAHELAETKKALAKAVSALEQIADLSQEHVGASKAIAASTLERMGFRKAEKMAS